MNIAGVEIGPDQPCRIVAEIGTNHNGRLGHALRLIEECADAGADFVKFQCYTPDELLRLRDLDGDDRPPPPWDDSTYRELYERAQTLHVWFPTLVAKCKDVGLPWFGSVFGPDSFDLLAGLRCPAYKIAAADVATRFAERVADAAHRSRLPVIASSRGDRVAWADLTLYCPPGYPQDWDTTVHRHQPPGTELDGVSYHGTDVFMPRIAIANGAQLVEVHVQLDDVPSELDAHSSLTVTQLGQLVVRTGARVV